MIRIDTHVALWLFAEQLDNMTAGGRGLLEDQAIVISPIVELELSVLSEVGKSNHDGETIVNGLVNSIGATRSTTSLATIVHSANSMQWTRDPFDRLITADAVAANCQLLTSDGMIRQHCDLAVW